MPRNVSESAAVERGMDILTRGGAQLLGSIVVARHERRGLIVKPEAVESEGGIPEGLAALRGFIKGLASRR